MRKNLPYIITALILSLILSSALFSQEKEERMTIKEYEVLLQQFEDRDSTAQVAIAFEKAMIEELKERYRITEEEINSIQQEILQMLEVWEADVANYNRERESLSNQIAALRNLTPEMLYQHRDELEEVANKLSELRQNSISMLHENVTPLTKLEGGIEYLNDRLPKVQPVKTYAVKRGDYLWKIAGLPDIYGDSYKWPRIWSANAESIKDPNIIYPDQILKIIVELDRNQRLVVKGDNLSKIASYGDVFGDPFAWTKLYEANKNQIEDPNIIYPEQILIIPGK